MKFSIVTPSWNQVAFLGRTLESVASQGLPDVEHFVADGGSTDGSVELLARASGAIRWISERDRGQAHAVNKGIQATSGDVVGWLNSDDIYYPQALTRVRAFFLDHPEVDVVYGMAEHIDTAGVPFEPYPVEPWNFDRLCSTCFLCQPAVFFRRRVFDRLGGLDESLQYCMDYEYWLRLAQAGVRFGFLPVTLAGSRLYATNKTLGQAPQVHDEIVRMMKARLGRVPDAWLYRYAAVHATRVAANGSPRRHARAIALRAILASVRWNRAVSRALLARLYPRWVRAR